MHRLSPYSTFFFFNDTATTEIYTLSLHDALPIYGSRDQSVLLEQVRKIERMYKEAGKDITVKVYDAGHAFINPDHGMGNEKAAAEAWPLAVNFLKHHLK